MPQFCLLFYVNCTIQATQRGGGMAQCPPKYAPAPKYAPKSWMFLRTGSRGAPILLQICPGHPCINIL